MRAGISWGIAAAVLFGSAAVLFPETAAACPVCGDADPQTAGTYIATTVFLSLLPLAMIGGGIWWLRRELRRMSSEEMAAEPDAEVIALGPVRGSDATVARVGE